MIGWLQGTLKADDGDSVALLEVAGVGYELAVGAQTLVQLRQQPQVELAVHTHVREDQFALFGFVDFPTREAFRALLSVSSIGPKLALAVVDRLGASGLQSAVAREDRVAFKGISGVGKKTVERILLDLKGKLGASASTVAAPYRAPTDTDSQVSSALLQMGYRPAEVDAALARLGPTADAKLEARLRDTLAELAKQN